MFQNFGNISCSFHIFMTHLTVVRMKSKQSLFFMKKFKNLLAKFQDTACVKRDGNRFIRLNPLHNFTAFPLSIL